MNTPAIKIHYTRLTKRGVDLGSPVGDEQDTGFGGRVQVFEHGHIYWHPNTGAHALRGHILQRYLQAGGPGANAASGQRELGFPTSDEILTEDAQFSCATFEWGLISHVSGTPLVRIFGRIHEVWQEQGGALGRLGHPLSDVTPLEGGRAAWFERGVVWHPEGSRDALIGILTPPMLGRPQLINPDTPPPLDWIVFEGVTAWLDNRPALGALLFQERLALVSLYGGEPLPLTPAAQVMGSGGRRTLPLSVPAAPRTPRIARRVNLNDTILGASKPALRNRTLYSLAFTMRGLPPRIISPHCFYTRQHWDTFGLAHITDLHVSRRVDRYRSLLRERGIQEEDVARLNNWNDAFRTFIRHANRLHGEGKLDVIIATGDLVDYVREAGDHPASPGNFGFLEALVRGLAPGRDPESPPSEPLRVPIFTSLGNHDYRQSPYPLAFKLAPGSGDFLGDVPIIGGVLKGVSDALDQVPGLGSLPDIVSVVTTAAGDRIDQFKGLNLLPAEAATLMGLKVRGGYGFPVVRPAAVAPSVAIEKRMKDGTHYYFRRINRERSYVIELGAHRIVMLDTRWDAEMPETVTGLVGAALGIGSESAVNFASGTPDSVGVQKSELTLLRDAIAAAGTNVVVVGMHAPPLNPSGTDLANDLRETAHPTAPVEQLLGWLFRQNAIPPAPPHNGASTGQPPPVPAHLSGWTMAGTPHFHEGPIEDWLDYGIAVGQQEALAKILAGGEGARPVTLLCSGHGHNRIEYRLQWDTARRKLLAFTDHYLGNPARYYPCRMVEGAWWLEKYHRRYLVRIEPGAPARGEAAARPDFDGSIWAKTKDLVVAPYASPLDQASDPAAWWQAHAPVVTQTAALGPCDNTRASKTVNQHAPGPNFQGFRMIEIGQGVIQRVSYALMDEVKAAVADYPAPATPTPPPAPTRPVMEPARPEQPGFGLIVGVLQPSATFSDQRRSGGTVRDHRR